MCQGWGWGRRVTEAARLGVSRSVQQKGKGAHVAELRLPRGASWLAALQEARLFERTNHTHLCHPGAVPWPLPQKEGLGKAPDVGLGGLVEKNTQSWVRWQFPWLGRQR